MLSLATDSDLAPQPEITYLDSLATGFDSLTLDSALGLPYLFSPCLLPMSLTLLSQKQDLCFHSSSCPYCYMPILDLLASSANPKKKEEINKQGEESNDQVRKQLISIGMVVRCGQSELYSSVSQLNSYLMEYT